MPRKIMLLEVIVCNKELPQKKKNVSSIVFWIWAYSDTKIGFFMGHMRGHLGTLQFNNSWQGKKFREKGKYLLSQFLNSIYWLMPKRRNQRALKGERWKVLKSNKNGKKRWTVEISQIDITAMEFINYISSAWLKGETFCTNQWKISFTLAPRRVQMIPFY